MILKNKLPILLYLLGFLIICLTLFVLWGGYRLYRIKHPPAQSGIYACSADTKCLLYPKTIAVEICPVTFLTKDCENQCGNPLNHCSQ